MSVITRPGQGCGHELRPGAQFCTVCGRPAADDTRRTGRAAGEQVPAPGPGATVIHPAPARPEPVNATSPATMTDGPPERPSGGGAGSGPQRGWPGPPTATGEVIPRHGGTTPHQGRRHRSRWPLLAGAAALLAAGAAAAAVIIGQPSRNGQAVAGTSGTAAPVAEQPASASATPTLPSPSAQQRAADSLAGLLAQSVTDRSSIVNAASSVSQCGPPLSQDPQVFETAASARQRLASQLASLPGRSALPGQMLQALTGAWQASAMADRDFARWARDELSQGCTHNDQADPNFQAAAGPDGRATTAKKAFVHLWNPMAAQYRLPTYRWNQL